MKEQLISLETEKLAKEKGFNFGSSRATQSLLQRWLREKHNISVDLNILNIKISDKRYGFTVWDKVNQDFIEGYGNRYEKALEKGLIEALKLIKL